MSERPSIDSLTLAVVEARLNAMNQELGTRLFRQCFSVPTSHIRDVGTVLFDGAERTLSIGNFMPVHTGGSHVSLEGILDYFGRDNIGPDDFILANHPFIVKFGHLADWSFLRPIFYKGELAFYHFCRTHQYDGGGAYPGCYFPRSYDCHGEGLILPPIKIVEGGKINESLYSIVLANVRGSTLVRADNMLIYGSMKEIENRIVVLLDEYGRETVEAACDELIRRARDAMRTLIAGWPAGTYYAERAADWDGTTDKLVWVRLALTVKPEEGKLVFDFSESDRQVDFINVPIGQVWSSVSSALLWSLPPDIPRNQGFFDSIEIITKRGSVLDPVYPATSACQSVTLGQQIGECVQLTLSNVSPKDTPALWGRHVNPLYAGKRRDMIDPRTGSIQEYTGHTFHSAPSSGASLGYDGVDGSGSSPLGGAMVRAPVEVEEWLMPYRWLHYEFLQDSAGAGQWRGGLGTHVEVLNVYDRAVWQPLDCLTMTGNADGEVFGSEGLMGGTGGTKTYMEIVKENGERVHYRTLDMQYLEPGDTLVTNSGGGGGYGDPLDREIEMVRLDAVNEYISLTTARDLYGVVLDPETLAVDATATTGLRQELRNRKTGAGDVFDVRVDDQNAGNQQGGGHRMSESMFKGITHTGLIVSDLDTLAAFLCDVFEMEVKAELGLQTGPEVPQIMGLPDAQVRIVMLGIADQTLELIEIVRPACEPIFKDTPYGQVGHSHVAFEVDDIDSAYARLEEKGVEIVVPIQDIPVQKFFYVRAPDNQWFEVVQPRR
jgi:N-methylhydantoinase B